MRAFIEMLEIPSELKGSTFLRSIRDALPGRLIKGRYTDTGMLATATRVCLVGASRCLCQKLSEARLSSGASLPALEALQRAVYGETITGFNDVNERTESEVLAMVDCAIRYAEEQESTDSPDPEDT